MTANNLTGWYEGRQKPVRVGVYQRTFYPCGNFTYSHWDGERWGAYSNSAKVAWKRRNQLSLFQEFYWRGIDKEVLK